MFANDPNIAKAQSEPIGRIIAWFEKPSPIEQIPNIRIRCFMFILPGIPAGIVSHVSGKEPGNLSRSVVYVNF